MDLTGLGITFTVMDLETFITAAGEGRTALSLGVLYGMLSCDVATDFHRKPLTLTTNVTMGDQVELRLMPHRIELLVNGELRDEEWPAGNILLTLESRVMAGMPIATFACKPDSAEPAAVTGSFRYQPGWHPEENVFVGDCMPYVDDGRYHVLYLKDRRHHKSKWGLGAHQWAHISTADFVTFDTHPMAVEITDPAEGSICTGSWIKSGDTHFLFYTIRMADGSPAPIRRSVSADGYHFRKDETFSFTLSDKYDGPSARDPKIIRDANGLYHMLLTTSLSADNRGCLAHLTSPDLTTWAEEPEPLYISDDATQPECPDYIEYGGRYYLIFSLHGKAHYRFSDRPFDGWVTPDDDVIPCHSVPKGAFWNAKLVFSGFRSENGYAGSLEFRTAVANADGTLSFE